MFLLFGGAYYYPVGGWSDLIGVYPTAELARVALDSQGPYDREWWQIVDVATMTVVEEG